MEAQFVLERVHRRKIFSVRAYEIIFTDSVIYFVHLGEDSSQLPMGQAMGGLAGAVAQRITDKLTEKSIANKLDQIQKNGLDAVIAKDRRSLSASYKDLEGFASSPSKWGQLPYVTFMVRGKGKYKFTFNLQLEDYEEQRQSVIEFMRGKRPDLVRSL